MRREEAMAVANSMVRLTREFMKEMNERLEALIDMQEENPLKEENRQLKLALERSEQELQDWRVRELKK